MSTAGLQIAAVLGVVFVALMAATFYLVYRQPRGRHHLQMRTRVRVYLGKRYP